MTFPEDRLARHVGEDESVRTLASATFLGEPASGPVTVGLTDRRLLCLAEDGAFADVRYEYVSAVRSRPRSRWEYRYRTEDALLVGGVGAVLAVIGVLVAVGSAVGAGPLGGALTTTVGLVAATAVASTYRAREATGLDGADRQLVVGAGGCAVLSLAIVAAVVPALSASLFAFATVGGLAILAAAPRVAAVLEGIELGRSRKTQLTIATVDGGTVRLVLEDDADLGRELGVELARAEPTPPTARSPDGDVGLALLGREPAEESQSQ
ncbi:hypothetical protein [Natronococcus occultus]|uniref:Uncharacterized protein n=1 Tax=Natronococcus occultus SP4 TaxID=694430 RepID=L0K2D5_9EURY|nr:hypothetical protein [Natronococcus occultus]AGB39457.1 hypothetical protein Natoc_3744 [Natronococcus occultus SP4]